MLGRVVIVNPAEKGSGGFSGQGDAVRKNLRNLLLATLLVAGPPLVIVVLAAGPSTALAEATLEVDGETVRFALQPCRDGVYASVYFDRDWIHYRRSVGKTVPGASPKSARNAQFQYDEHKHQAQFLMESGGVVFERHGADRWSILLMVFKLPGDS